MEQSQVRFGRTPIDYAIHRSARQKTVAVRVNAVDGVQVRSPRDTPIERLDEIVRRKAKWIVERRRRLEDIPPPPSAREFVSGETFLYLGRQYRLKLIRRGSAQDVEVRLKGGRLATYLPGNESGTASIRDGLIAWYRGHAEDRIPERMDVWAEAAGLEPTSVLIREQRRRWGSAGARGIVRINWRVIQAPMRLVDYVVAHELIHLRHFNHTRGFWSDLGRIMPDYEERREALRQLGPVMLW